MMAGFSLSYSQSNTSSSRKYRPLLPTLAAYMLVDLFEDKESESNVLYHHHRMEEIYRF